MKRNTRCFFGLVSLFNDVKEEIRSMADRISFNGVECQTRIPSKFVGLGVIQKNSQKNSITMISRGDISVLIDGEIYNIADLKTELMHQGYSVGEEPCDIVSSGYEVWGTECFNKLNGMYAMALWDKGKNKLYLNRDPHGAKALYYHFDEKSGLTFASRLSVIFQRKNISPDIEFASVQEYLRFLDISAPNTIYKEVCSLKPGYILECDGKDYSIKPVRWVNSENTTLLTFDGALNKLEYILTKSVQRRIDNGKTGFFLSSGIDSSALCVLGAKIAPDRIEAFTVGFDNEKLDEAPMAKQIARFLGIRHHELYFNIKQYYDAYKTIISYIDSPFADPAVIPTMLCFDYCKKYVDVAIDGTGADGLFGYMLPRYIRFALNYSSKLPKTLREKVLSFMNTHNKLNEYAPIFDFEDPEELLIRWKGWSRKEIEKLCGIPCHFDHTTFYKVFNQNSKSNALELYSALLSSMPDDRLHEIAYLCDVTVRFPYWDEEFVTFVKQLPVNYKYKEGEPKFLLRKLLSKYMPETLWNTEKHGFNFPFELLLKWKDFGLIKKYLNADSLRHHGFFNNQIVKNYVGRYINGDSSVRFKIWALVTFQAWFLSNFRT